MNASYRDPTRGSRLAKRDYEVLAELRDQLGRYLRFSEEVARRHGAPRCSTSCCCRSKATPAGREPP